MRSVASGAILLAVAFAAISPGVAEENPETNAPAANPALEQLLRMADFMAKLPQFSVTLDSAYDAVQDTGQKIEFGERRELVLVRPNHLRVDVEQSDGEASRLVFDGQSISLFNATWNLYATSALQGDIDAAIKHFVKDLGMRLPLAMLLVTTLPEELKERVQEVAIVETTRPGGKPVVHLAARTDSVDFQVWIPETGDPLPSRIVLTYKDEPGQPQYRASFSDWNLSPSPLVSLIAHDIPADATRIPFLVEMHKTAKSAEQTGAAK
jgi:hypothetical protein